MNLKKLNLDWEFAQILREFRKGRKYIDGCCGGTGNSGNSSKKQIVTPASPSSAMQRGG